jgi:hypothetical protein
MTVATMACHGQGPPRLGARSRMTAACHEIKAEAKRSGRD